MVKFLSSMRFAFWLLITIIIWFFMGVILAKSDTYYNDFKSMSNMLTIDWLENEAINISLVLIWFLGLCLIAFLLAINFIFCSWNNLLKISLNRKNIRAFLLLSLHFMFVIIMAFHLGAMIFGFKYSDIELMPGDSYSFENQYSVKLDSVHYTDDTSVLKLKFKEMRDHQTKDKFHYQDNYARISLYQNEELLEDGIMKMLMPFHYENIRISMIQFYLPKKGNFQTPGVKINIVKDLFAEAFFISYAIEIVLLLSFVIFTWRKR
ncbi:MAG: hypothetical protein C0594_01070 [Marinilabiliales bacterium]|nr:MAG: hypothetical protein C0594_01070 [Marinilabiliales bacterium]